MVAVSAHRGGSEDAPSATIEAYASAVASGAEYVEFDIRRTRDGHFVVFHDDRIRQVRLAVLPYEELCAMAGYRVPRVGDVMRLLAGRAVGHLDLKEIGDEDEVIRMALDLLGPGNFVATTLEDASIARIKRDFPEVLAALSLGRSLRERAWIARLPTRVSELYPLQRLRACNADWVAVHRRLAGMSVLRICARTGVPAMVWTVNAEEEMRRFLADERVTVLITDHPRRAVRLREALENPMFS
jgi:glycerophosphoryl diester phosphodiesterase